MSIKISHLGILSLIGFLASTHIANAMDISVHNESVPDELNGQTINSSISFVRQKMLDGKTSKAPYQYSVDVPSKGEEKKSSLPQKNGLYFVELNVYRKVGPHSPFVETVCGKDIRIEQGKTKLSFTVSYQPAKYEVSKKVTDEKFTCDLVEK